MIRKWSVKGQIPETQLPEREMCPECGNKYFPAERPTDCEGYCPWRDGDVTTVGQPWLRTYDGKLK
jgi:hypothetical protein